MAIKGWVVHKVNRLFTRVDLPPRATPLGQAVMRAKREPELRGSAGHDSLPRPQHLGAYAPLVAAIRDELEQFVASHVRMHLAIAEHDRYLLTSIEVECEGDAERDLLRRFMREFKPRQIKTYIEKEVIGRLPNASAIDLAHFGGLNAAPAEGAGAPDEAYGELLAELRSSDPQPSAQPFQVSLKGRWSELDLTPGAARTRARSTAVPRTPLAGRTLEVEIEDANGHRHVTLSASSRPSLRRGQRRRQRYRRQRQVRQPASLRDLVRQGRLVGDGQRLDQRPSRRDGHDGAGSQRRQRRQVRRADGDRSGARVAHRSFRTCPRRGDAVSPRLLKTAGDLGTPATPLAPRVAAPTTPTTPIVAARSRTSGLVFAVSMTTGERTVPLPLEPLPFRIGRSRSQSLVIDWAHEGVSGQHVDIVELDDSSAKVVVHGDNGVTVAGITHPQGSQFRWQAGETMRLGRTNAGEPECTLTLSRKP
jgi:hypothetical protein